MKNVSSVCDDQNTPKKMSKLLNRSVNSSVSIFGVPHRSDRNVKKVETKNHYDLCKYSNNPMLISESQAEGDTTLDSDVESIILDLNKLSGLSSSSSLSWSDDYEKETTKKIYDELKRLNSVLKGDEPIPPDYDMEECNEWMNYFPNLSIFDDDKTPTNSTENLSWNKLSLKDEENVSKHDNDMIFPRNNKSARLNLSSPKIFVTSNDTSVIAQRRSLRRHNRFMNDSLFSKQKSFDVEQYLKVSPVIQNKRNQSSKSLLNRQISEESPDNNPGYSSLPHLKIESLPVLKVQRSSHVLKKKPYSKMSLKNNNHLILPPIDTDHFRSVSAMPTDKFKTLSALSVSSNFKEAINSEIHSHGPIKNLVSSRRQKNILL